MQNCNIVWWQDLMNCMYAHFCKEKNQTKDHKGLF